MQSTWMWKLLGAVALAGLSLGASATKGWVWLDDAGRQVFSDMPPPASVPNNRIIRQPAQPPVARPNGADAGVASASTPATPAAARPGSAAASGSATAPNGNVVLVETDEQLRAVEKQNAEIRADNCRRAQEALATLQRSGRLATINDKGQRVMMDANMRKTEIERAESMIRDNCK
jgi:hypothetical protein